MPSKKEIKTLVPQSDFGHRLIANPKGTALEGIETLSNFAKDAAEKFRENDTTAVLADYTEKVVKRLETMSESIREADLNTVVTGVKTFAKRHPEVIVASMFAAGLLVGRFFKSAGKAAVSAVTNADDVETSPKSERFVPVKNDNAASSTVEVH